MALFFLFMLLNGLANELWMFVIGRPAVGGASVVTPVYISEVDLPKLRGRLVATA